jgi:hypothetical protein
MAGILYSIFFQFCTSQPILQIAALHFGDFYNMQYVKMYTIFMMQLQVNNEFQMH